MNKGIFKLIFDVRRGMRVPAAECAHGRGKQKNSAGKVAQSGHRLAVAASLVALMSPMAPMAYAVRALPSSATLAPQFNLPQAATNFNQLGRATQGIDAANAQRLVVNQQDQRVILNWSSFDIGAGYGVRFNQPTGGSALNRIGSISPSVILGSIDANAEVILYNANGVLFGKGATVNTGNFIATTLNIADSQFENGFRNITAYGSAFAATDAEIEGFVRVENGASITSAEGGDILLFAPRVLNEGQLAAPGGQVALAAGQKVYLAASVNPAERGLLVEVDPFDPAVTLGDKDYNTVENAARGTTTVTLTDGQLVQRINEIVTERGSASLVGLSVKQMGAVRATTAVKGQNGAIYLLAHGKTVSAGHTDGITSHTMARASELGELVVGPESVTRVDPDASSTSQLDAEPFYDSIVRLEGKQVHLQGDAQIIAPGAGSVAPAADTQNQQTKRGVSILASANPLASGAFGVAGMSADDDSRIVIDPGVLIDVSGADVDLPMSSNVLTGRLFSIQLADAPLQRTGVLYRQEISFDRREGAQVADVSDFYSQIGRTAAEKLTGGGSITIQSDGAVVVGQGSKLDVSGGSLRFAGGEIKTTQLRKGNQVVDISDARPDVIYDEVMTSTRGRYETAYVEGKNAGELTVAGRQVVLDGELSGGVTAGRYQRGGAAGARPAAGRLQVGIVAGPAGTPDYYVRNLVLAQTGAATLPSAFFADPFNAVIPSARADSATISAQAIMAGGFGRIDLMASDGLRIASGTALKLGAGGTLTASASRIEIDGAVSAPAGAIALNALPTIVTGATPAPDADISVVFAPGASLSTAGEWTNDGRLGGVASTIDTPVATGGGSIKVAAYGSVLLPAEAALDVSAGAWRNADGKVSYGKAGAIDLAANVATKSLPGTETGVVQLDGAVSGYGFSGGGSFTLSTLGITVSDTTAAGLWLKPAFFSANGFESINLKSITDLTIADNTDISARLRNRVLNSDAAVQESGTAVSALTHFANSTEVDDATRKAVNLSFAATRLPAAQAGVDGASLVVGRGATVATEAGGALSFSAGKNLTVAGTLAAPGGKIALTTEGVRGGTSDDRDGIGFLPAQALWLTDTAKILAGGTGEYAYNLAGLRTGTVYGGGTVMLNAKHGYLVAEAGSLIDIGGYETIFDLYGGRTSALISRDAGSLALSSPEGIFVDSTIRAAAPSPRALGGALALSISRQGLGDFTEGSDYPVGERKIVLQQAGAVLPAGLNPEDDLNAALGNGVAAVSAQAIESAGFAAVSLRADDRIEFAQNVALSAPRSLELNTRVIAGQGSAAVSLAAPYVALGDKDILPIAGMAAPSASSGAASLTVTADLIDLVGTLGLQGFNATSLSATRDGRQDGEIRLRGRTPLSGGTAQTGSLLFAGVLDLRAGQISPTTLSAFEIAGLAGDSTLRTHAPVGGSTSAPPWSAFGDVKLSADTIEHGGVVRAPFGRLELNAVDTLSLLAGSELSVSGDGLTVPVGATVNGTSWFYFPLGTAASAQFLTITELPVAKQVLLNAGILDVSPTALVSATGGGEVQAAEFIPGAGGSSDYLADAEGLYAVLPDYAFDYAPYDAQIQSGAAPQVGEQIVITMTGSALAPGRYTLLPAAYALTHPDAVLVSRAADQGGGILSSALALSDGGTVVTGYRSAAGTTLAGDDYERYLIEPAATFRAKSEYRLTGASDFFTGLGARLGSDAVSLPRDAGRISLAATQLLDWKALFDLSAPAGGKAGEFDLTTPDIVLVKDGQTASAGHTAADGYTAVSIDSLAATGAASILLGGTRSGAGAAVAIDTISDHLRVESEVHANELLLVASRGIEVADSVAIVAGGDAGTSTGQLNLTGDGALLRVSNRTGVDIVRTGVARAAGFGDMVVGENAGFSGAQVDLDTTGNLSLDSSAVLSANSFGLGAGRIAFSGPSPEGDSVVIDGTLLTSVRGANSLSLRSYSTIDFLDSLNLALIGDGRLLLDTAGLRGLGDATDHVNLSAGEVLLRNSTGGVLTANGTGALHIEAHPPLRDGVTGGIEIGAGSQSLGFDGVTLASKGDLTFSGTGQLDIQGDLDLVAERLTGATGADQAVTAAGVLSVSRPGEGHTLDERVGLGAKLALAGQRVVQNGAIDLPGGQLSITALNDANAAYGVEFGTGSVTRAGGFATTTPDGWQVFGDAGSIDVTTQQGAIKVDGVIGVAAQAGGGSGGTLKFSAAGANGTLDLGSAAVLEGGAGAEGKGGTLTADLEALPDDTSVSTDGLDGLASATTDFTHKFDLRVRTGNVALAAQPVKAETVLIAADAGSLTVTSTIDAGAPQGGVVQLAARDDVTLGEGGRILANATRAGANGGDVLLASTAGLVTVAAGSVIDAGGDDAKDGRVVLRAARGDSTVNIAPIAGNITAGEVSIEAVKVYSAYTSLKTGATSGASLGQSSILTGNTNFMANKNAILASLGVAGDARFHLRPGVEVDAAGAFTVTNDWNLYSASRPGGEPGFLTLRAVGNLNINGTISDGFNGVARNSVLQPGDAWSLRLAAGADLGAANPLAVNRNLTGDLTIAGGKLLRTSSGSIELAAGRDIVLGGTTAAPATVMVTGTPSALDPAIAADFTPSTGAVFTAHGGRLAANAGRDLKAPVSDQTLINNWFFRSGRLLPSGQFGASLAWWSRFDLFRHGFGSFGGGNIALSAGRDIQDVGAFAPTSARMASLMPDASKLVIENGGDIAVSAGGNIAGGSFFAGRGAGSLEAGGKMTTGTELNTLIGPLAPVLALMDGGWNVRARGDAAITAAFNPTIMAPNKNNTGSFYYTYSANASLDIASAAGDVFWRNVTTAALNSLAAFPAGTTEDLANLVPVTQQTPYIAPPTVRIAAHAGDIDMDGNSSSLLGISLYPSATGNFELYGEGDVALNTSLRVMDNSPASLASVTNPVSSTTTQTILGLTGSLLGYDIKNPKNKLVFTDLHTGDDDPLRIHAQGSLTVLDGKKLISPKQAVITAGLDIVDLTLYGQHHRPDDVTLIAAGRNFFNGTIQGANGLIVLGGPGTLDIKAGRQLNLGASAGVETVGNLYNTTLPSTGASVKLAAGLDASLDTAGLMGFLDTYLAASGAPSGANYRDDLVNYVKQTLNQDDGASYSYADALNLLKGFSADGQITFVKTVLAQEFARTYLAPGKAYAASWAQAAADAGVAQDVYAGKTFEHMRDKVLFNEIKLAGITGSAAKGAAAKEAGYAPGYTAIDLAGYGAPFGFTGNIDLIESKVQTKSGGGITFFAPGGGVNVGLSADVSSVIGAKKKPEDRGVVALAGGNIYSFSDGDFLVNAQKVFVIGKGDILLWSSNGNIDSGRGSNNTVTVPPLVAKEDPTTGEIYFELPTLATGSGIGILDTSDSQADGVAYLFAPRGEIIALDAFIRAPSVFFDPEKIRGADNVIGVAANPVSAPATVSVGALGNVSNPAEAAGAGAGAEAPKPGGQEKNSILTVEILAMGDGAASLGEGGAVAGGSHEDEPDPADGKKKKARSQ